jgi:hypothetical protein
MIASASMTGSTTNRRRGRTARSKSKASDWLVGSAPQSGRRATASSKTSKSSKSKWLVTSSAKPKARKATANRSSR